MKRAALFSSAVIALAVLSVGCSSSKPSTSPASTTAAGGGATLPAADGTPVHAEATDQDATHQKFTFDTTSVAAGKVTFTLKNSGNRQHELIVLKTDTAFDALTVGADNKVSEDASVGEISETDAGKTGTLTVDLKPGKYVLVCNIEKHYGQGMRIAFTVTG